MLCEECLRALYNTNLAKFRKILTNSIKAHSEIRTNTEYDAAFHHGMEHVLFLLDNFMRDEWEKIIKEDTHE